MGRSFVAGDYTAAAFGLACALAAAGLARGALDCARRRRLVGLVAGRRRDGRVRLAAADEEARDHREKDHGEQLEAH